MTIFETLSTLYSLSYTFSLFKTKNKTTGKFFFASEFVRFVFNFQDKNIIDKIIKHGSYNFGVKIIKFFRETFHERDCAPKVEESTQLCKFLLSCESDF